jgi:hypothetical protein
MKTLKLIENTKLVFKDISTEKYRTYEFESGFTIKIENPLNLHVGDNAHRIFDAQGISHYIPYGWVRLYWEAKEDKPNFIF